MKFQLLLITLLFFMGPSLKTSGQSIETNIIWDKAKCIGYTKDNRLEKWALRDFARNQPPMDFNTRQPTEKEFKAIKRKVCSSVLLSKSFSRAKEIAICGLGLYEVYLNDNKVGVRLLDPASSGVEVTGNTQTDICICKVDVVETRESPFTCHGFQFSNEKINNFYNVSMIVIEDYNQRLLSDCTYCKPFALMGDAYVVTEGPGCNFDLKRLWQIPTDDMQTVLGMAKAYFKDTLPYGYQDPANVCVVKLLNLQARPDLGAATVMIPYFSYSYYGDINIIKKSWDMMQDLRSYLGEKVREKGMITSGYGNWCPSVGNPNIVITLALTTALYDQSLVAMQKMATLLDKDTIANNYVKKAQFIKEALNKLLKTNSTIL